MSDTPMQPEQSSGGAVRWCRKCGNPDQNFSLRAMTRAIQGSVGYHRALSGWSPAACECDQPEWEDDSAASGDKQRSDR